VYLFTSHRKIFYSRILHESYILEIGSVYIICLWSFKNVTLIRTINRCAGTKTICSLSEPSNNYLTQKSSFDYLKLKFCKGSQVHYMFVPSLVLKPLRVTPAPRRRRRNGVLRRVDCLKAASLMNRMLFETDCTETKRKNSTKQRRRNALIREKTQAKDERWRLLGCYAVWLL
jgi:hypothetical protein